MPQSSFDYKLSSQVQGAAWTQGFAIAPPGSLAAPLFAMYPSLGDKTIATATNIDTVQDGPMKVTRYGALTVNAALTVTQRCRGHIILCDSLAMGAAGSISMTARGAAGAANWPVTDLTIPQSVRLSARYASQRTVSDYITQNGIWIGDPVFWAFPDAGIADCRASITAGSVVLLSAAGCGDSGGGVVVAASAGSTPTGGAGNAGSSGGTGGGGGGCAYAVSYPSSAPGGGAGYPWGGGAAAGGGSGAPYGPDSVHSSIPGQYGGRGGSAYGTAAVGGSAGNPGSDGVSGYSGTSAKGTDGTGGVLIIICRGNVTRNASDSIEANGGAGGGITGTTSGYYYVGGAGSGGGHISLIYGGTITGTGNTTANGGAGGTCTGSGTNRTGAAGGAGSVVTKTFAQMGWT